MNAPAIPDFDLSHRAERVTNISPASDAFVLFTLATLLFTIGCFAVWMGFIWLHGRKTKSQRTEESDAEIQVHESVPPSSERITTDPEEQSAPWEKPADWWKQ